MFSKYYEKYKKSVGVATATKVIQFENYNQTTVQDEIQNSNPFIGEMESTIPTLKGLNYNYLHSVFINCSIFWIVNLIVG